MDKQTSTFPYHPMIQKLIVQKSNLLLQSRFSQSSGEQADAQAFFEETAKKEEEIAHALDFLGDAENALISWASAASCYLKASKPVAAQKVLKQLMERPLTAAWKHEIEKLQEECQNRLNVSSEQ
jgi:hypothetical protein